MTATLVAGDSTVGSRRERSTSGRVPVVASYAILAIVIGIVVFADLIAPYDPNKQNLDAVLLGPSWAHPFGTDDLGRDLLSRMFHGTRVSVLAAGWAVVIAVVAGVPLGLTAGYLGKAADVAIMRVVDALMSFPAIVLAIGITATLGPDITTAMTAVGVVLAPTIIRLTRAQTLSVKEETFVEAARSFGARGVRRLILPHVLPNVIQPVLVQIAILMGFALIAEASLSFLQLGVQPPTASWGSVLSRAYTFYEQTPLQIFIPGIAIALTVFALNIIGDDVQRRLDPKRKER